MSLSNKIAADLTNLPEAYTPENSSGVKRSLESDEISAVGGKKASSSTAVPLPTSCLPGDIFPSNIATPDLPLFGIGGDDEENNPPLSTTPIDGPPPPQAPLIPPQLPSSFTHTDGKRYTRKTIRVNRDGLWSAHLVCAYNRRCGCTKTIKQFFNPINSNLTFLENDGLHLCTVPEQIEMGAVIDLRATMKNVIEIEAMNFPNLSGLVLAIRIADRFAEEYAGKKS